MSISTITAAQRAELRDSLLSAELVMQKYTQSATTPRTDETEEATPVLEAAAAALVVAGASGLPATSAVVANGGTVNVENSAGALDSPATAVVAANVLTSVKLGSTKTILTQGDTVTITDSNGTPASTGTATVAAGVVTNVAITSPTSAIAVHGDATTVQDVTGATVATTGVTLVVAAGVLTGAKLGSAQQVVANTVKRAVGTVSGSGTFGTFTVVNGVITGIVLSAS